jgi:undecaprenyl diphosphate synthase
MTSPTCRPRHLAVIMDGNRRWARARGLPDRAGHTAGVDALQTAVAACLDWGIPALTVFGWSTENWGRGAGAAAGVLGVARAAAAAHAPALANAGVRLRFMPPGLTRPRSLVAALRTAEAATDAALGGRPPALHLTVALGYGARADLGAAAAAIAADVAAGRLDPSTVTAKTLAARLSTAAVLPADLADPDLVIRTASERRLSNFLLFESAYAELAFLDELWPDVGVEALAGCVRDFAGRSRRFGGG